MGVICNIDVLIMASELSHGGGALFWGPQRWHRVFQASATSRSLVIETRHRNVRAAPEAEQGDVSQCTFFFEVRGVKDSKASRLEFRGVGDWE